jgi:hypothetical protein
MTEKQLLAAMVSIMCEGSPAGIACPSFNNLVWDDPVDNLVLPQSGPAPNTGSATETFPSSNAIRLVASATMTVIGQQLNFSNTNQNSPLTIPDTGSSCNVSVNIRSVSGFTTYDVKIWDVGFNNNYFDTGLIVVGATGTTTYPFVLPAGLTQVVCQIIVQCGQPNPPLSGAIDIQADFGV